MTIVAQSGSAAIVVGPILNVSGSVMVNLDIANTGIVLVKYASVSGSRNATTSALSVGPGLYRVVLNSTDTDTMGEMALWVSGSAALPFVKYIQIWNANTHALYYGSADAVAGSAAMSAMVSAVTSAVVSGVLNSYNVASAGEVASAGINSAGISAIVQAALVAYDVPTSADVSVLVSVGVNAALNNFGVPTSAAMSAMVSAVLNPYVAQIADAVWDEELTGATHNVANSSGRRLRGLQDNGLYALASVWVDEVAGTSTGTTAYEDATVTNRSNDLDNAQTVADAIGIKTIHVSNGNSITLTAALEGYNLYGSGSVLALGSQNLGGTIIQEFGTITGIGTTTGNPVFFEDCLLGAVTLPPSILQRCGIGLSGGTFTIGSAGDFLFVDCYSRVAGSGAPTVDLAGVGATTVQFRRWSGGLTLNNVATGDVVSVDVVSGGTITVNGTGGTVAIRGHCNVVDGSSGSVTITQTSVVNMTKINSEVDTAISDASAAISGIVIQALTDYQAVTSAGLSAQLSVRAHNALVNYDVASSADVSAVVQAVLVAYDAPTSAGVSAIIAAVGAPSSAAISGIVIQALTDYQAVTSAGLSVQLSVRAHNALVNYDVASSADVSAIVESVAMTSASVSTLINTVLSNYGVPTSAAMSAMVSAVLNSYNVASAGEVASATINSAGISAIVQAVLVAYDAPTSADVSVILANAGAVSSAAISGIVIQALTDYDVASSGDVSAIFAGVGGGLTSAQVSTIVAQALSDASMTSASVSSLINTILVNYDVASSGDVSAIFAGVGGGLTSAQVSIIVAQALSDASMTSASVSSLINTILVNYDVASSGDVSAIFAGVGGGLTSAQVSGIIITALTQYDVPTSSDVSAIGAGVLANYDAPTSADISAITAGVLTNYDVPTSADISAIASAVFSTVLGNYDVATSADVSVIIRTARVNIGRVNDVSVSGAGTTADPWRPA